MKKQNYLLSVLILLVAIKLMIISIKYRKVINSQCDRFIVEKINQEKDINIDIKIRNILSQFLNIYEYIKSIFKEFELYNQDKDIDVIEHMIKVSKIYIPGNNINKSIINNNNEFISIKNEKNIIPYYYTIENDIIGPEKIKYDLGTLSLNDSEFQNIYLASFDDNIKFDILKMNNDVILYKRDKLYILKVNIKEKKEENIEDIITEGSINFSIFH